MVIQCSNTNFGKVLHDATRYYVIEQITRTQCRCVHAQQILFKDRKSTRLNSSHLVISYAVFCLKKKNHLVSKTSKEINRRSDYFDRKVATSHTRRTTDRQRCRSPCVEAAQDLFSPHNHCGS